MVLYAFSLQDQVEKYGAYVGLAAFFGLAVLSLLYFAQARELKRLREWAGRAPERAQELEERVVAQATASAAAPRRPTGVTLPQRPAPPRKLTDLAPEATGAGDPARGAGGGGPGDERQRARHRARGGGRRRRGAAAGRAATTSPATGDREAPPADDRPRRRGRGARGRRATG